MVKNCGTCDHHLYDERCIGCVYDAKTDSNTKWRLKYDPDVIERKVIEDIRAEIEKERQYCELIDRTLANGLRTALYIIDKHISGKEKHLKDTGSFADNDTMMSAT